MIYLVIGKGGSGKTTWVRQHLGDGLAYDLDYFANAMKLQLSDKGQRSEDDSAAFVANELLMPFCEWARAYAENVFVIRCLPSSDEIDQIAPDILVVCSRQYVRRPFKEKNADKRLMEAIEYARTNSIQVRYA